MIKVYFHLYPKSVFLFVLKWENHQDIVGLIAPENHSFHFFTKGGLTPLYNEFALDCSSPYEWWLMPSWLPGDRKPPRTAGSGNLIQTYSSPGFLSR